ncbi:hypothetical protein BaRGS_00022933 [Batillaria attramentaria]|uniref:Uncharacterized protein n=1 Tax=Batillaria attramentaria TaxID=370345 RepID=A0ABD0KFC2_9CAEN
MALPRRVGDASLPAVPVRDCASVIRVLAVFRQRAEKEIISRKTCECTDLRMAAAAGHRDCVVRLLSNGADVNMSDDSGCTPLHIAVMSGRIVCAEVLLRHGADPDGDARTGTSPVSEATLIGRPDIVKLLLKYNARSVLQRTSRKGSFFTLDLVREALVRRCYSCVKVLLAAGGRPPHTQRAACPFTKSLESLYHTAVRHDCGARFGRLLFEFGLVPWVADSSGVYPWDPRVWRGLDPSPESDEMLAFIKRVSAEPRSLTSCCRVSVWSHVTSLGKTAADLGNLNNVPDSMRRYLTFAEL